MSVHLASNYVEFTVYMKWNYSCTVVFSSGKVEVSFPGKRGAYASRAEGITVHRQTTVVGGQHSTRQHRPGRHRQLSVRDRLQMEVLLYLMASCHFGILIYSPPIDVALGLIGAEPCIKGTDLAQSIL